MPDSLTALWTPAQVILTGVILACCAVLVAHRRRAAGKETRPGKATRGRPTAAPADAPETPASGRGATLLVLAVFAGAAVFLIARAGDPLGVHPDSWSDANVIVSGRNYARLGLFSNAGAAQHQVVTDTHPQDPFYLYTRYPVGSNLINGMLQSAGIVSVRVFRSLPMVASLMAAGLWFLLLRRLTGGTLAVAATLALVGSFGFLAYADALHFHAYAMLTVMGAISCYVHALATETRRRAGWLLLTALLMFLTACLTWEYHLWLVLFMALYALLFPCPVRRGRLMLLAIPFVLALGLQAVQSRMAAPPASDVTPAVTARPAGGLAHDIYRRTIGFAEEPDTPQGVTLATYPAALLTRYARFYGLPALGAAGLVLLLLIGPGPKAWRWREWTAAQRLLVILLVAGAGWWCVMLQHTSVHPHVMRQGLMGFALLLALAVLHGWRILRSDAAPALARGSALVLLGVLGYAQVEGVIADVRTHLQRGYEMQDTRERSGGGFDEAPAYAGLVGLVPPGAVIVTNSNRLPLMRAVAGRPVYDGRLVPPRPTRDSSPRSAFELSYNHLRQVYADRLPSLYYVYVTWAPTLEQMLEADPVLRVFILGDEGQDPASVPRAVAAMEAAARDPGSGATFCPMVGTSGPFYVFRLDPMLPALHAMWSAKGPPSLEEFGPAR